MYAIEIQGLHKTYGKGPAAVRALTDVDMTVRAGEVLMLMGPSGSGKTTLLSVIGCILSATSGSVRIAGKEVAMLPESKLPPIRLRHFGFVFQSINLFPALTARENVAIALNLRGIRGRAARNKAEELLTAVGLAHKLGSWPGDLSGGEKQRTAIARALAGDPPILLADEPTAALDSETGRTVMELLTSLARRDGRTVVVVTHDDRVAEYADRILHVTDGRISRAQSHSRTVAKA
ncbi:MAG: ABC transporter ATP-binding protein [Bryobacteraceae bacterium]